MSVLYNLRDNCMIFFKALIIFSMGLWTPNLEEDAPAHDRELELEYL